MIKATCPNNPDHDRFITTAQVIEDWYVDEHGVFIKSKKATHVVERPCIGNIWTCVVCGIEANVERVKS
jgi:hypothetical protein